MSKNDCAPVKGKILCVKEGFNPNSSSIGSGVIVFFTAAAGVSAVFAVAAGVVMARFKTDVKESEENDPSASHK